MELHCYNGGGCAVKGGCGLRVSGTNSVYTPWSLEKLPATKPVSGSKKVSNRCPIL